MRFDSEAVAAVSLLRDPVQLERYVAFVLLQILDASKVLEQKVQALPFHGLGLVDEDELRWGFFV